jgi:hypothetical protein
MIITQSDPKLRGSRLGFWWKQIVGLSRRHKAVEYPEFCEVGIERLLQNQTFAVHSCAARCVGIPDLPFRTPAAKPIG